MLAPDEDHSFSPSRPLSHQLTNQSTNRYKYSYGTTEIDSTNQSMDQPINQSTNQSTRCRKCCQIFGLIGGLMLSILFILLAALGPHYINQTIDQSILNSFSLIDASTDAYRYWSDNQSNPPLIDVYINQLINPIDWLNGEIAELREIGPFIYRDRRVKFNVKLNNQSINQPSDQSTDQSTNQSLNESINESTDQSINQLTYQEWQYFEFVPEGSISDPAKTFFLSLNLIFFGYFFGSQRCSDDLASVYQSYQSINEIDRLVRNVSVQELLFGWTEQVNPVISVTFPGLLKNASFEDSQYNGRNGIYVDPNNQSINRQYFMWNNQSMVQAQLSQICGSPVPVWNSTLANTVRGSDAGSLAYFPYANQSTNPPIDQPIETSKPLLFYTPYQTALELEYTSSGQFEGINVHRFSLPQSFYDNSSINQSRAPYYQIYQGAIDLSRVSGSLPTYATSPRQQSIDPSSPLSTPLNITYLPIDQPIDQSFWEVERNTGESLHFIWSSQINLLVNQLNFSYIDDNNDRVYVDWFPKLRTTLFPLMWAKEETSIDQSDAAKFRLIQNARIALNWAPYVFYPLGGVFLVLTFFCCWRVRKQSINQSDDQSTYQSTYQSTSTSRLSRSVYSNDWNKNQMTSVETYGWE